MTLRQKIAAGLAALALGGGALTADLMTTGGGASGVAGGGGGAGACASGTTNTPDGPDPWGGCWPGPTTTGVPSGTSLTVPSVDADGDYEVTVNNTVVDGIDLTGVSGEGGILVEATGVTIKNSKVRFILTDFAAPNADGGAHPTVIQDTEINCQQALGSGIATAVYYGNYTLNRVKIHDCENGLDLGSGHVIATDSYWYHLYMCPTSDCLPEATAPHSGVVQGAPGVNDTLQHNWMEAINESECKPFSSSDIYSGYGDGHCNASGTIGWNNLGSGSNNDLIKRNMIKGGGSSIRCPQLPSTNFVITENLFHPEYNDPAQHATGLSDDCAPYDAGDNRDARDNSILALT